MRIFIFLALSAVLCSSLMAAEIRAAGGVDLPGFTQSDFDKEPENPADPFDRSIVSIARNGTAAGVVYGYSASSDIGLGELKAFGSLINGSANDLSSIEIGLLRANAFLRDTITIENSGVDDYDVTFEFHIDGVTDFSGGSGFAGGNISTGGFSNQNDFFSTNISQTIDETLSVTRTYNGTVEQTLTLQLFLQLNTAGIAGSLLADLGNTATLNIILPQGATITGSESGTFLEVITPVPVPPLLPLIIAALTWLTTRYRRV